MKFHVSFSCFVGIAFREDFSAKFFMFNLLYLKWLCSISLKKNSKKLTKPHLCSQRQSCSAWLFKGIHILNYIQGRRKLSVGFHSSFHRNEKTSYRVNLNELSKSKKALQSKGPKITCTVLPEK